MLYIWEVLNSLENTAPTAFFFCLLGFHIFWQCCWRISCHFLCNTPKCNYSTCTNIPASVPLILPPKIWQHYGHVGTQVESLLPTIRAPHLRLSEQPSQAPEGPAQLCCCVWSFFLFSFFTFRPHWMRGLFTYATVCKHEWCRTKSFVYVSPDFFQ